MSKLNRVVKLSKEGFTLVELMIVVAIIGILSTIAVPQYQKFQAKSKQTEAKIALAAIYTVESAVFTDQSSYSASLSNIGYTPDGNKFYYTVGWTDQSGNNACGPAGTANCLAYTWNPAGGAAILTGAAGTDVTLANLAAVVANLPVQATLTTANGGFTLGITSSTFTVGALSNLSANGANKYDAWSINNTKSLIQTQSGI